MTLRTALSPRRPRTWIVAGALALAIAATSVWWFAFAMPASAKETASTTRTVSVTTRTIQKTVSGTGTLTPSVNESVEFGASGTVTAVNVVAGSTVTAGQALATVDSLTVTANLLSAKATLASAQAKLSDAEDDSDGTASALASIASDKAAVTVAAAAVATAQTAADSTTLVAPVAGLVTAVNVEVGDSVSSGTSSNSGGSSSSSSSGSSSSSSSSSSSTSGSSTSSSSSSAAFTIIGTDSWTVSVSVSAANLAHVAVGEQVNLSTDENSSFFGTVTSVGMLPSTTTGAATYPVVVTVTGSPTDLYDGVSVTAAIVYQREANVVAVPSTAISTQNGTSTVQKLVNGKAVKTTVTTGLSDGSYTEITKGLSSGDQVQVTVVQQSTSGSGSSTQNSNQNQNQNGSSEGGFPSGGSGGPPSGGFGGGSSSGSGGTR